MSFLDQLDVAVKRYLFAMPSPVKTALDKIDKTVVKDLSFTGFRPDQTSAQVIGHILICCHDGRWARSSICLNITKIQASDSTTLYRLIESAVLDALEAVNGLVYEDPFVTWAKEVRRDAGVS